MADGADLAGRDQRMGPVDGPENGGPDAPMMLGPAAASTEYPTTVPAEMLEPNRFAEEQPGERDIEQAIGEWRKSGALAPSKVVILLARSKTLPGR